MSQITAEYVLKTFDYERNVKIPFYVQFASYIRLQIQAGNFKADDVMVTETKLCEILNVSRTTIRQSFNMLVEEGYLVRTRGRGSYISKPKLNRRIDYMYNFTESINRINAKPSSVVLDCKIIKANSTVAEVMKLPLENSFVFYLRRLRCANNQPILVEESFIPALLCPNIIDIDFSKNSLYSTLKNKYGLNIDRAQETIEAIIIDKDTENLLKCGKNSMPGYRIERLAYLKSGMIFEFTRSITRADKCVFKLELKYSNKNGNGIDIERKINT
ncbi:MAG: GntR family transcriptional regulator [Spirochaetia bacterium]|nr:GntR family transcriptional regulator [Spirochaetia bacterium]